MRNYIILNGKNSNQINGLLIQELPPISKPLIRTETEEIDGRDGDIVTPLGYSAYDKELTIGLYKNFDVNEVAAYFNSEGTVIFSNEPDKYYYYQITAQIDFERLVRYRTATVTMHCQPFKYSATEQPITEDVSGTVSDEGTNLALENTAEAPFNTLDLKGNTAQQTYTGKNLFSVPSAQTKSGVTLSINSDGTVNIHGTNSSGSELLFPTYSDISIFSSTSYTLSASKTIPANLGARCEIYNGSTWLRSFVAISSTGQVNTQTPNLANGTRVRMAISIAKDATVNIDNIGFQLEQSSSATSFEPYVGGVPAPNPDYPQAVQTVTGENVVKIHGKNLLEITHTTPETKNGITVTWEGSSFVLNGTASANTDLYGHGQSWGDISKFYPLLAGTYTMSVRKADMSLGANFAVKMYNNSGTSKRIFDFDAAGAGTATSTLDADSGYTNFYISITSGRTFNNERFYVQLEKSSQATEWEDYQEQSYEINLGKNLFDKDNASEVINAYIDTSAHKITTGNNQRLAYIECEPNTTYTISKTLSARFIIATTSDTPANNVSVSQDIAKNTDTTYTITTNSTAKYLCVFCYHASYDTLTPEQILSTLQIEKGSTATTYAAYFEPIELCGLGDDGAGGYLYKDGIYKNLENDKWYVRKEIGKFIYSGASSESWQKFEYGGVVMWRATTLPTGMISSSITSDLFKSNNFNYWVNDGTSVSTALQNGQFGFNGTVTNINFKYSGVSELADWTAWLNSHPTAVYYPLATPTDTEITNEALIEQLDNIYYHAHAYKGRTHISSSAATGNVPHIIAAEVGEDNESTITNAGNYLSKPKITVYGSGDISLYINDMHVLQITLGDEGYITIDTAQMEAYKDTLDNLKNRLVIGDYSNARLKPGANKVHFTGTVTKYVVENYSRWL